jgi:hypothetical protein
MGIVAVVKDANQIQDYEVNGPLLGKEREDRRLNLEDSWAWVAVVDQALGEAESFVQADLEVQSHSSEIRKERVDLGLRRSERDVQAWASRL